MTRFGSAILLAVLVALTGCGSSKPSAPETSSGNKGQYGVFYYVSLPRPIGGAIQSIDGKINCGTSGGTANACGPASYQWGEKATLQASADAGYTFFGWAGDCSGSGSCVLDNTFYGADKTVAAVFTNGTSWNLTVAKVGGGKGTITATIPGQPAATCAGTVMNCIFPIPITNPPRTVTLSAAADASSSFAGWNGACSGMGTCAVAVGGAKVVTAAFERAAAGERAAAAVTIAPAGFILAGRGSSLQLSAVVTDSVGAIIDTPVTWRAVDPSVVQVSPDGLASATADEGSGQVVASAGLVNSAPSLGIVASPAAGTQWISDGNVSSPPSPVDLTADYGVGWQYRVHLVNIPAPVPGSILMTTGQEPVAGRVVSAVPVTDGFDVILELAPVFELFPQLVFSETIYLRDLQSLPPSASSAWDVEIPRRQFSRGLASLQIGPFECDGDLNALGIQLSLSKVEVPIPNVAIARKYDWRTGHGEFGIRGIMNASFEVAAGLEPGFSGSLTCEAELGTFHLPIAGALSLAFGAHVPFGVGFQVSGGVTSSLSLSPRLEISAPFDAVWVIDDTGNHLVKNLSVTATPKLNPSFGPASLKVDLAGYAYAKIKVGAALGKRLGLKLLDARGGAEARLDWMPAAAQAWDPSYVSDWQVLGFADVAVDTDAAKVFRWLGLVRKGVSVDLGIGRLEVPLWASPEGVVSADPPTAKVGVPITFTVALSELQAALGTSPISGVEVHQAVGEPRTLRRVCSQASGSPTQVLFTCATTFDTLDTASGPLEFYAFALDREGILLTEVNANSRLLVPVASVDVAPVVSSFNATPAIINVGGAAVLAWDVFGASSIAIGPGVGMVTGTSVSVTPTTTTTYTLTATNAAGSVTRTVVVNVAAPPAGNGVTGMGTAASLATIPNGANGWCWYGTMERAIQTTPDGITRVAATEYRACDTRVDRLVVHARALDGTWSQQVPFTYNYSAYPSSVAWTIGMPGTVSAAVDSAGGMHVVVENKTHSSAGMAGYGSTQGLVYAWGGPTAWQALDTGISGGPVQVASGNVSGVPYAGVTVGLAYDPSASLLRFIGHDGAWWATSYHVLESTGTPGVGSSWTPYGVVATSPGAVDRGAIIAEAQDFTSASGAQVWVDGPTCRLKGRELSAGGWSSTIDIPLGYSGCSYQASNYFGFSAHADVVVSGADLDVVVLARPSTATQVDVLRYSRRSGAWTTSATTRAWSINGAFTGKVFAEANGDLYVLHLDSTGALAILDMTRNTDLKIRTAASGATIFLADCSLRSPAAVAWTERLGGNETLYSAQLTRGSATPSPGLTGAMAGPRFGHTATLLSNGKVLVAGGHDGSATLATAEVFDPATGSWTTTGPMAGPHYEHTATMLPNGKVLVVGGWNANYGGFANAYATAELYDPLTATWAATNRVGNARSGHTATLLPSGKVLVTGGNSNGAPFNPLAFALNSTELYDPSTGTWTFGNSMGVRRYGHTATLLPSGAILVTGGDTSAPWSGFVVPSTEVYSPATGVWAPSTAMTSARYKHSATLLPSGRVLLAGGWDGYGYPGGYDGVGFPGGYDWSAYPSGVPGTRFLSKAEIFDPASLTWIATGNLAAVRYASSLTQLPSGKTLVVGGYDGLAFAAVPSSESFDPDLGLWTAGPQAITARHRHTATVLPSGAVLIAGGLLGDGLKRPAGESAAEQSTASAEIVVP